MLVLSRKVGESLMIGDDILVTIVRITPTEVRIGVKTTSEMTVYRAELGAPSKNQPTPDSQEPPPRSL